MNKRLANLPILGLCAGLALVKYVEANFENFIGGWMIPLIGFLILLAVITLLIEMSMTKVVHIAFGTCQRSGRMERNCLKSSF